MPGPRRLYCGEFHVSFGSRQVAPVLALDRPAPVGRSMPQIESQEWTTTTSTDLLIGLKEAGNSTAWGQFVHRYRQPILRCAAGQGLSPHDSEDVAQRALTAFSNAYQAGNYNRERGRLRDWLFGFVRIEIKNCRRQQARHAAGDAEIGDPADEDRLSALWEQEWRQAVLQHCFEVVRREVQTQTFQAFELFALQGLAAREVAQRLGVSENAVFGAKRRVLRRIRELLPQAEETW